MSTFVMEKKAGEIIKQQGEKRDLEKVLVFTAGWT